MCADEAVRVQTIKFSTSSIHLMTLPDGEAYTRIISLPSNLEEDQTHMAWAETNVEGTSKTRVIQVMKFAVNFQ
jgi:hypothetical protein